MTQLEVGIDGADAAAVLACQTTVLELICTGAALERQLDCITEGLERLMPDSRCSLLLLDDHSALRHGSAPRLPADYLAAIDGLEPGPDVGSCGTAAHLGEAVVVTDIASDPRWVQFRDAAFAAGLRACWSTPVLRSPGQGGRSRVLGTFAVYHDSVHEPTDRERHIVDRLSYLASVVLEHAAMIGALSVSEERFRRAFDDNAVAMTLLDGDGRVTRANDAMGELTGLAGVAGLRLVDLLAAQDRQCVADALRSVRAGTERSVHCDAQITRADATRRAVSLTVSSVRGASGESVQLSVSMLDVTERLAAQRERRARLEADVARRAAEAASRAKSGFLSAVSHEMRTPLQAITGFAELLATLDLDAPRRKEALAHIATGAADLLELVDDTLDLARIEARALPLDLQPTPAAGLVDDVVTFLMPVAQGRGVQLTAGPAQGVVCADPRRLRQVLINLVSNGIRYSGATGRVEVTAAVDADDTVALVVVDNGPGIPVDLRTRLFEPFTGTGATNGGEGVGLGLMLARGLAESMSGTLTLADGVAGGTVATVRLPRVRAGGSP